MCPELDLNQHARFRALAPQTSVSAIPPPGLAVVLLRGKRRTRTSTDCPVLTISNRPRYALSGTPSKVLAVLRAPSGTRTRTSFRIPDFESDASANSCHRGRCCTKRRAEDSNLNARNTSCRFRNGPACLNWFALQVTWGQPASLPRRLPALVPRTGLEPVRRFQHLALNQACLPFHHRGR